MVKSNQGHWIGLKADTKDNFGFIYIIRDKTIGRAYIGKKQFWAKKPKTKGCKTAVADKGSPKWKHCCWKESDWRTYRGSSKSLAKHMKEFPDNDYEYEILYLCRSRGVLTYSETQEQWRRDVLGMKMTDGNTYRYWNRAIGAIKFRPPAFMSEETKVKLRNKVVTDVARSNMSAAQLGNQNSLGSRHSEETKKLIGSRSKGRKHSKEFKESQSVRLQGNTYGAYPHSLDQRRNRSDKTQYTLVKGSKSITATAWELYTFHDLPKASVLRLIKGKIKTTKGWKLIK